MGSNGGRTGSEYRTNAALTLAASDICGICGHPGAKTIDHIITRKNWPIGMPGWNGLANMRPAHGTKGTLKNRCPECGKLCNQERGAGRLVSVSRRSADW